MMRSSPNFLYHLLDKDYHEAFDRYTPDATDFHDPLCRFLPPGWNIVRRGIWFQCTCSNNIVPQQGWKIHLSATPANAREVLTRAASILFHEGATFKFAVDISTLLLINGKNWARGAAGKFITVYPRDHHTFLVLIDALHHATRGLCGPYILSDYRYQDSKIVFYRYGGMRSHEVLNVKGEKVSMLTGPDGSEIPDQRLAYPITPSWEALPVPATGLEGESDEDGILLQGRFKVEEALSFSSAGGVYRATDQQSDRKVVIKEARPHIHETGDGCDAVDRLAKEYRFLKMFEDTGIAARPICLFKQWEHLFLVEEYVDGIPLGAYAAQQNILLRTRPAREDYETWYRSFRRLAINLARIIQTLHSRNVIFTDLSTNNVLVCCEGTELKLIDFEGAELAGQESAGFVYTPGFISKDRLAGAAASFADDYYSLGAVLLAYLMPWNGLLRLRPEAREEIIASIRQDAKLPASISQLILNLLDHDPARRPEPADVLATLERAAAPEEPVRSKGVTPDYLRVIDRTASHIQEVADYGRRDRLFPSDPAVFTTNPLSMAYGACGIAYALKKTTGAVPQAAIEWILSHRITTDTYAPGLYTGLSGVAWSLLECGAPEEAKRVLQLTFDHPLLYSAADLFYGASGWGLANLRFFHETGDELYLDKAKEAASQLLRPVDGVPSGAAWEMLNEKGIGLAHGGSGIALFLLYLFLVTRDERLLGCGKLALDLDICSGVTTSDNGLSWPAHADARSPLYPYWRHGSAGVGMAAARYWKFAGMDDYRPVLEKIFIETDRRYAVLPGRFKGLAGLGDFLLDMYQFTGEKRFLESSHKVAEGIMTFRVERNGIAFPGDDLSRLSCDYGTGSSGIALFLHRLSLGGPADFMLDRFTEPRQIMPPEPAYAWDRSPLSESAEARFTLEQEHLELASYADH